jgi:hypothetical protein
MSEQAGTESDAVEGVNESPPSRLRQWIAPAWFLLGVLVGVISFAAFATLNSARPRFDETAMREAARDGTLDAIATLQAGGPQPESRNSDPPQAAKSFAVRDANRAGDKDTRVTIVEFSDFQ